MGLWFTEVGYLPPEFTRMRPPRFSWGDTVRVVYGAPQILRPGVCGEVVSITPIDSAALVASYGVPLGSVVYEVEFCGGEALSIEEAHLEPAG